MLGTREVFVMRSRCRSKRWKMLRLVSECKLIWEFSGTSVVPTLDSRLLCGAPGIFWWSEVAEEAKKPWGDNVSEKKPDKMEHVWLNDIRMILRNVFTELRNKQQQLQWINPAHVISVQYRSHPRQTRSDYMHVVHAQVFKVFNYIS